MIKAKHLPVSAIAGVLLLMTLAFSSFGANGRRFIQGQVPPVVASLRAVGNFPTTNQLQLAIGLPLRDQAGLDALLKQIYDPASPNYHQYLAPEQFAENFGPTKADYQAVIEFMEKNGLTVTGTHPNRVVLDVTGSVADIEKTFQFKMRVYQHPKEQRTFYAPDTEPSVDATLTVPLLNISGLDNYSLTRPASLQIMPTNSPTPNVGSGPGGAYLGKDFRQAYVPGTPLTGTGQSVALVQFDGYYASDITAYATLAGLPPVPLTNVPVNGGIATPGANNIEVALDIEMAMSMATNLSSILVYEAPNGTPWPTMLSKIANDNLAKQIGCSWGGGSANPNAAAEVIFKQMAAQGQSFFCASGDADAYVGGAVFPDDSTNITVVGGTTLSTTTFHNRISENTWNSGGGLGTGGGISTINPIPVWQLGLNPFSTNGASATARNVPDVALTADNIYVKYGNGQATTVVGTSCAAPLWAGFMALVNQQAVASGKPVIGFINPAIYELASQSTYTSNFFDITTGNNTWSNSPNAFFATAGYDLCTGLGSPRTNFIYAMVSPDPLIVVSNAGFRAVGTPAGTFNISSQTFSLTNVGTSSLTWSLSNTSVWLSVSTNGGTLTAGAGTAVTVSLNTIASNLVAGDYSATLSFSNATGKVGHYRFFTLKTVDPLVILPPSTFSFTGPPGGPFTPNTQSVILTNPTPGTVNWGINNTSTWFTVSPANGSLTPGDQANVTFAPSLAALSLSDGSYSSSFRVTNLTSGYVQLITGTMSVGIMQNGGFETGDFSKWTLVGNGYDGTNLYNGVVTTNSLNDGSGPSFIHSGSYGAFLGDTNACTLSQSFPTIPGQSYRLSFWLDNPIVGAGQEFSVNWNTNSPAVNQIYFITNPPVIPWTNMIFIVQATDTNTTLQFGSQNPPNGFGLDDVTVVALSPPTFTGQPTNLTGVVGSTVLFNASVSGFAPLTYQWYKDGVNLANGSGVSGATTTSLTLAGVTTNSAADYTLVVTNAYGAATSSVATLTVVLPPAIITALTNQTIECGGNATFAITASGTPPLSYQWKVDGTQVSGVDSNSLELANIHLPNHTVAVIVTDFYSSVTNSSVLTVLDTLAPTITLNGASPVYVELGDGFSDPGATASDVCAGSVAVVTNGTVNPSVLGTNQIVYTANDGNGNSNAVTRIVIVHDTTAPVITWSFTNLTLVATTNNSAPMPDVTGTNFILATDLSGALTISQDPTNDFLLPLGTNLVVITVTDSSGNAAYSTNSITVVAPTNNIIPEITSITANPDGSFDLSFVGASGSTYILETTTNLYPPIDWLSITTNTLGTNTSWQFTDTQATNFSMRFYRLKSEP